MSKERLQKIIARCSGIARRKAEELIRQGLVTVDGHVAKIGNKADYQINIIEIDGKRVKCIEREKVYLLLNKPRGYLCTIKDPSHRATVMDLIKTKQHVYPVGRLDMNSSGLVILTNDGDLANKITHAGKHCPKVYLVKVAGTPDDKKINRLTKGISIGSERFGSCLIEKLRSKPGSYTWLKVTLYQGKNRQIRRMFDAIHHPVFQLKRIAIGPLSDRGLPLGSFRPLKESEIKKLKRLVIDDSGKIDKSNNSMRLVKKRERN